MTQIILVETNKTVVVEDTTINVTTVGTQGPAGPGLPTGGTTAQVLVKNSNANFDTEWATNTGTGTVTSVTFTGDGTVLSATPSSAVTISGTVTAALKTQTKNTVFVGPASGVNAAPTFRALVGADLPNPSTSSLGGVEAIAAVAHNFITSISTSGVPTLAQPSTADISGLGTAATHDAGDFEAFDANISKVNVAETRAASIDMNTNQLLRPEIKNYAETRNAVTAASTTTIDITNGNVIDLTHGADITTFTWSNPSASGKGCSFTLIRTKDNSATVRAITWPASVKWAAATAPTLTQTANAVDIFTFMTVNAGTTWYGFLAGADIR